jgi:hypothetical protein
MTGLGYQGADFVLDKEKGPLLLELNARPGLNVQIANRAGLLPRLKLVEAHAGDLRDAGQRVALAKRTLRIVKSMTSMQSIPKFKRLCGRYERNSLFIVELILEDMPLCHRVHNVFERMMQQFAPQPSDSHNIGTPRRVLIVGGVAGGASCAGRLRRLDESIEIVMIDRGPYVSFANCGLPYYVGNVIPGRSRPVALRRDR